jgi:hypothetical protein
VIVVGTLTCIFSVYKQPPLIWRFGERSSDHGRAAGVSEAPPRVRVEKLHGIVPAPATRTSALIGNLKILAAGIQLQIYGADAIRDLA